MKYPSVPRKRGSIPIVATSLLLLLLLLLSACNGDPQTQQQASKQKAALDAAISDAQNAGVPDSMLQPILQQRAQLSATNTPFFSDQSAHDYYANLAQRYSILTVQVRGLMSQATQQFDYQATLDIQALETVLAQRQGQNFVEAKTFADQLTQYQNELAKAQQPKDYLLISSKAKSSAQALRLMGPAYDKLVSLRDSIKQMQASNLDVTLLQQEEQYDTQQFRSANKPEDFSDLIDQINTQLNTTATYSTQAIPYVGSAKLKQLSTSIGQLNKYGVDTTSFQKRLDDDQKALDTAKTLSDFLKVSSQIDADTNAIQLPLLQGKANYYLKQFHDEVNAWGSSHLYHDPNDGKNYPLDYEYNQDQGFGSDLDDAVKYAQSADDYQAAIDAIQNQMQHLKAMETDYNDKTSWNQAHNSDLQLIDYYKAGKDQVIVVSLVEQALRLYQNGKLVRAFQITTGQFDKPSPPGFWHVFLRQSPTKFKSSEPKGSAFWYPDTNINYAMEYHDGGYFLHDSWWRADYGPGTNFPHTDSGGDESFAGNGSHGCVNMPQDQAGWLYNNTAYGTAVILY